MSNYHSARPRELEVTWTTEPYHTRAWVNRVDVLVESITDRVIKVCFKSPLAGGVIDFGDTFP